MSKCVQIKEEYKRLTILNDAFVLESEKAVETGDLDNAKKLKAELEKAVAEFKEKLVYPGMIFNHLKGLAKKNNIKIQNSSNIHTQPNGDLAGSVEVDGKRKPFVGDRIIDRIGGKEFDGIGNIHTQPNGDLAGRVRVDGKWKPFVGDRIIDRIGGKEFDGIGNIHTQPNGDLAGSVRVDYKLKPFIFDGKDYVFYDKINEKD